MASGLCTVFLPASASKIQGEDGHQGFSPGLMARLSKAVATNPPTLLTEPPETPSHRILMSPQPWGLHGHPQTPLGSVKLCGSEGQSRSQQCLGSLIAMAAWTEGQAATLFTLPRTPPPAACRSCCGRCALAAVGRSSPSASGPRDAHEPWGSLGLRFTHVSRRPLGMRNEGAK